MKSEIWLHYSKKGPYRIFLRCDYASRHIAKEAGMGTALWRKTEKVWSFPVDPVVYANLLDKFPDAEIHSSMKDYVTQVQEKQQRILAATSDTRPIPEAPGLWEYQRSSVRFLAQAEKGILAHQMALGKTVIVCGAIAYLRPRQIILVVPPVVSGAWVRHLQDWAGITPIVLESGYRAEPIQELIDHTSVKGNRTQREEFLGGLQAQSEFCLLLNYAQMRIHGDALASLEPHLFVADEAHRIKNARAEQSKQAHRIAKASEFVWLLTGTPVRTDYDDYFSQLRTVDPVRFTGYFNFLNIYLHHVPNIWGGIDILGVKDRERFNRMLSTYVFRKTKDEVLENLPKKVYNEYPLAMEEEQQEAYDQMLKEFRLYLEQEEYPDVLYAKETISQLTRLRQIALNPAIVGGVDSSGKERGLIDLLEDLEGQFLVFATYRDAIHRVQKILEERDVSCGTILGGMSTSDLTQTIDQFERGDLQALAGTIDAMGEGIDLPQAQTAIFLDKSWTPAVNEQAEDRIHRPGVTASPTIINLYHPDSIDEHIRMVCQRKEHIADSTIGQVETVRSMMQAW